MIPAIRPGFNPDVEADTIHSSVKGPGTDDSLLISALSHMTHDERVLVSAAYTHKFNTSLLQDVHDDTSGHYRDLLEKLILPRGDCMARCINDALKGLGTDDYQLITLLACFPLDIPAARDAFKRMYKRDLVDAVKGDTSGNYERVLCALITRVPVSPMMVDPVMAKADVETLYKAGEKRLGTDEDVFIQVLTGRSNAHLIEVNRMYEAEHKKPLIKAIEKETSGNFERVLKALVMPRYEYLARAVDHAISRPGTEEDLLNLIFALCEKNELGFVSQEYKRIFKKDMSEAIRKDTSFNYEKLLVALF